MGTQSELFPDFENEWEKEWHGMPEFVQDDLTPFRSIIINFSCPDDIELFKKAINETFTPLTKSLWYPSEENIKPSSRRYVDES